MLKNTEDARKRRRVEGRVIGDLILDIREAIDAAYQIHTLYYIGIMLKSNLIYLLRIWAAIKNKNKGIYNSKFN